MPLKKNASKAAVSANIKTELGAGKPRKQAIAIALDEQRRARAKSKARAHKACKCGGKCNSCRD
jgi:hypothetical protein